MKILDDQPGFQAQLGAFGAESRILARRAIKGKRQFYARMADLVFQNINHWTSVPDEEWAHFCDFLQGSQYQKEKHVKARVEYLSEYATKYAGVILTPDMEIGSGAEVVVYRYGNAVIKQLTNEAINHNGEHLIRGCCHEESVDDSMRVGILVAGKAHFEQLLAASYTDVRKIHDYIDGYEIDQYTNPNMNQMKQFDGTVSDMKRTGLGRDDISYRVNVIYRNDTDSPVAIDLWLKDGKRHWVYGASGEIIQQ